MSKREVVRPVVSNVDDRTGVVWFRRDLRLDDNPAWAAATANHRHVVAVFVTEPGLMKAAGRHRRDQLVAHLHSLDSELRKLGGALVLRDGPAEKAIPELVASCDGSALYLNSDASPFSRARDEAVERAISTRINVFHGNTFHAPGSILTKSGTLSQVFTPFFKTWSQAAPNEWPSHGSGRPITVAGLPLASMPANIRQEAGEVAAWNRLTRWLAKVDDYASTRDRPDLEGTSNLSADLKFGTLSARAVADVVGTATEGRASFVRQIAWRDWWAHTLAVNPDLLTRALRPPYDDIAWRDDASGFERWCSGQTGYPIVDAGMRQLAATGWMHGRVRMICASFLVKDLLIDWRAGERFFRRHLVDGDVAQNAGNWQWVAGTGADAAPYFRIFNPITQSKNFDGEGNYIRTWVPELAALPASAVHQPSADQRSAVGYASPVVDHSQARQRALAAYKLALRHSG